MNDLINGTFEIIGGLFILLSVFDLYKKKQVSGIDWRTTAFFFSWGLWNLYFYPSLDQTLSFIGGVFMSICNLAWVILLIKYSRKG